MTYTAIIEARMGSSRLPGKVMFKINKVPIIILLINRLRRVKKIRNIIVATTPNKNNDILCRELKKRKIKFFRGDEENVLDRVLKCALKFKVKNIVQITGDCPLIDPEIVSQIVATHEKNKFDFVSNSTIRTFPDGMDVCIFSSKNLKKVSKLTNNRHDLEHVSLFMKRKKKIFSQINIMAPQELHLPKLGLTLDELKDFKLIEIIFKKFWKKRDTFSCLDIVNFLNSKKGLISINKKVKRNKVPFNLN
tara:strand:+ start:6368 stop:7114 length:747 start_codon:yes stop_codon:yes gene_type:complete